MSVKVKLKIRADILKAVSDSRTKDIVSKKLISMIKEFISKGISPVKGERRFVGYKNPAKYPAELKSKRPVNLYLSGDMLAALKFYPLSGAAFSIAIKGDEGKKAAAHNNGTDKGIPRRHFMPTERGEEFNVTITRKLRDLYARILFDIIKRSNSR